METELISVMDVANHHGKHRTTIFKIIKRLGIETKKQRNSSSRNQLVAYITQADFQRVCDELSIYWTFRPPNAQELKRCVEEAFADEVYPGDDNITISGCICGECTETRAFFGGKHWRDVAAMGQPFQVGWGGLPILSAEAWRFYLPAYLIRGLSGGNDDDALTTALYSLTPDAPDQISRRDFGLSVAQQRCIAAYARAAVEAGAGDPAFHIAAAYWEGRAAEAQAEQGAA
jgi:hypothetical protein